MDEEQFNRTKKAAKALTVRVEAIERHLEPLLKKDLIDTYNTLPVNEKCQLDMLLAFGINSLYYMYIKTQGQDPQAHAVFKELKRVQQYIHKFKEAEGKGRKPTMKLDKEAAGRFVKAAISSGNYKGDSKSEASKKRQVTSVDQDSDNDSDSSMSSSSSSASSTKKSGKADMKEIKGKAPSKKRARMDPFKN